MKDGEYQKLCGTWHYCKCLAEDTKGGGMRVVPLSRFKKLEDENAKAHKGWDDMIQMFQKEAEKNAELKARWKKLKRFLDDCPNQNPKGTYWFWRDDVREKMQELESGSKEVKK